MPNNQVNVTDTNRGNSTTAPLLLLTLMRDLEVLANELWSVEETTGQPISTYRDPLAERLRRVGVSDQKIEDFGAWTRILSGLISDDSRDEGQLSRIVAAEEAGLKLLADLVASLRSRSHKSLEETSPPSGLEPFRSGRPLSEAVSGQALQLTRHVRTNRTGEPWPFSDLKRTHCCHDRPRQRRACWSGRRDHPQGDMGVIGLQKWKQP